MTSLHSVLLVDDSDRLRELYRLALEADGRFAIVGESTNGLDAINAASAARPALVLLDLSMPTMDGLEALGRIRAVSPRSHVVVLTGFGRSGLGQVAKELGASDYVEKGIMPSDLANLLAELTTRAVPAFVPPGDTSREAVLRRAKELI